MMRPITLAELAQRCHAKAPAQPLAFTSVTTDSRKLKRGDLFVALRGEHFDGHDFVSRVAGRGACGAVVEQADRALAMPQLVVDNTVQALGQLGALNREQFAGPVVGITGSSGKTTVKEMVAAILKQHGCVLVTRGNLNNHLGVPMMLLELDPQHRYAVIEMGASAIGEIAYLAGLAKPQVSVITNVGTAHIGGFGSVDRIAEGKAEIYRALPANGIAIINRDDCYSDDWLAMNAGRTVMTFSARTDADVMACDVAPDQAGCCGFSLCYRQQCVAVQLAVMGEHNVMNALAAAASALALGFSLDHVKAGLESVAPVAGRMQVKQGLHAATVIDDTYNANPGSVRAAIDALKSLPGKRVLVLGDMAELGDTAEDLHAELGCYAKQSGIDVLLSTGNLSAASARAFGEGAQHFANKQALVTTCLPLLGKNTVVLVKGSRSSAMEDVVQSLLPGEKRAC
jgi:UDP-N-acetylmuramoyl-tripeptide--D-alanyl-D-alanine ligase